MKKVSRSLVSILILLFISIPQIVYSYEFDSENKELNVKARRKDIYDLYKIRQDFGSKEQERDNKFGVIGYNGVCSTVTVNGKSIPLDNYIAGVIKQEMGLNNIEALKAQAIAARSFVIGTHKNSSSCSVTNGQSYQAYTDASENDIYMKAAKETSNMVIKRKGEVAVTQYQSYPAGKWYTDDAVNGWSVKFQRFNDDASTAWTWNAGPGNTKDKVKKIAGNGYSYGTEMNYNNDHHYGMSQTIANYLAVNDHYTYDQILKLFYNEEIVTLQDGVYDGDIKYVTGGVGNVTYWNQNDFGNYSYGYGCGSIAACGCGPTSVAIIASTFKGQKISPVDTTKSVCSLGGCTSGGSYNGTLGQTLTKIYGIRTKSTNNDQEVIKELGTGNTLVIAHMGPGVFTSGGHYIVLTGVNDKGQVSVADPASTKRTQKKWFDFNIIISQKRGPYTIAYKS